MAGAVLAAALSGTCRDSHAPTTPAEAITQTATVTAPGTAAILVGAGNIARCDRTSDEATAALLDRIPGTVFALGDDANPSGTAANYANCYDPGWGRHKARTSPYLATTTTIRAPPPRAISITSAPPPASRARATTATTSAAGTSSC